MIPQKTENREPETANEAPRTANEAQQTEQRVWKTNGIRDWRRQNPGASPALAPWPQPVPIVEVGTRVRASDGQHGIVVDVQDTDGPLTYLVQLDGQSSGQFMPACTLKGALI